jgi:phage-related protein
MFKSLDKKTQKELNMAIRKPQNFIKHADKDPDSDITYDGKLTELIIHDACQLYRSLKGKLFHEGAISIMDV